MYLEEFKQQQHHSKSMRPPDDKSSSAQRIADHNQPPVILEGLEATYQEKMDMKSQDLRSQSPDTASLTKDSMDEVRSISEALGIKTPQSELLRFHKKT